MSAYFHLAQNILKSNFVRLPAPYKISFILTYRCNFRCKICNIWTKHHTGEQEMTLSEIDKFFSKNKNISWLNLGGGEMFLRKDILEIPDIIYRNLDNLLLLDFPTTGYFTDKVLAFVQNVRVHRPKKLLITVSLDGPKELHEEIRGIPTSWDRAVTTFKELRAIKSDHVQTYLGYTLSQYNFDRFFDTISAVRRVIPDLRDEEFHLNLAQSSEFYYQNKDLVDANWAFDGKDRIIAMLNQFLRSKGRGNPVISYMESRYQNGLKSFLTTKETPLPCKALSASCFVDPSWNVYPCITYNKTIANLRDNDFDLDPIWQQNATRVLRQEIEKSSCPNCWTPCEAYQTILGNLLKRG